MYAIVDIAGQQFKVEKDQKLFVHRLEGEEGKKVSFDKVLLIDTGRKVSVGDPVVKGASVDAKIIEHMKADKVLVFKKKRRKGYKKLNGHRQYMTQILIEGISEKGAAKPKAAAEKPAEKPRRKKQLPLQAKQLLRRSLQQLKNLLPKQPQLKQLQLKNLLLKNLQQKSLQPKNLKPKPLPKSICERTRNTDTAKKDAIKIKIIR